MYIGYYRSPIGWIKICANDLSLASVEFVANKMNCGIENNIIRSAINQFEEYFNGLREKFDIDLLMSGTVFQMRVWDEVKKIEYAETCSYEKIAQAVDNKKLVRVVASAIARNKLAIIIPCHRVVLKNGASGEYKWGRERKKWLIDHEKNIYRKISSC